MRTSHIRQHILSSIFLVAALLSLNSCGGGGGGGGDDGGDDSEPLPTESVLVTSRSPDHNDINVSTKTDITITADQSLISDGLDLSLFDVGKNEDCEYIQGDGPDCPWSDAEIVFTNPVVQGNTVVFSHTAELKYGTNYIVFLRNNSDDFLLQWSIRTNQGGVFLDSPVINIGYRTETLEGVTNAQGTYPYIPGESVTFFIGNLVFPTVTAKGTVTPLDLVGTTDINNPEVINMIRLLQTLDDNGNPDDGLTISDSAATIATQVDFSLSELSFENSTAVKDLIDSAGNSSNLVATAAAKAHFQALLDALEKLNFKVSTLPGTYNVVAIGVEGINRLTIKAGGSVDFVWGDGVEETGSWTVNSSGQLLLSGSSFSDILTLTSGDQSSGSLDLVLDDEDGLLYTTGTINLVSL